MSRRSKRKKRKQAQKHSAAQPASAAEAMPEERTGLRVAPPEPVEEQAEAMREPFTEPIAAQPTAPSGPAPRVMAPAAPEPSRQPVPHVSQDQIRRRAYEIYMARGGRAGGALNDWLQAERELGFQARSA